MIRGAGVDPHVKVALQVRVKCTGHDDVATFLDVMVMRKH